MLEPLIVHDQHNQVDAFDANLKSRAPTANGDERRCAPAFGGTARSYTASVFAAKMNPPLIMFGTTRMHFALLKTSSGMPLSGVAIIACNTSTEESSRATESCRAEPAQAEVPTIPIALINNTKNVFFMESFPLGSTELRGENFRYADLAQRT